MATGSGIEVQIGKAWGELREGNVEGAITGFDSALNTVPNNVDAHYGLGLAFRKAGRDADAIETFQKALELSKQMLEAIRSQIGGDDHHNSLATTDDDRYMMLGRMIRQRLAELGVKA
ncbi:MAG: hypothetical protein OHK0046_01270 [Anaerolineae bacterium]